MSGIYLHIPFCKRKCHYCNFFSVASLRYRDRFLKALEEEVFLRRNFFGGEPVMSVYFGGGTPSLLDPAEINHILGLIRQTIVLHPEAEITLEANPDDITPDRLQAWRESGINRLSIGVQSFFDEDLVYLNRLHDGAKAMTTLREARDAGFTNLSLDLIYGIPTLTDERWQENIRLAIDSGVQHLSAYALTVEPRTALEVMIRKKKLEPVSEDQTVRQFRLLMRAMQEKDFLHYEISNFCREGFYSRHNSMYWDGGIYLGLGPAAHSYDGSSRRWNLSGILHYADLVMKNERFFEEELLTAAQKYNEFVMVSLRTMWGCNVRKLEERFGPAVKRYFEEQADGYLRKGFLEKKEEVCLLTEAGKLYADGIASDLFLETEEGSEG